jgi:hypothetical protein
MTIEIGLSKLGIRFINGCDEFFLDVLTWKCKVGQNNMGLSLCNCAIVTFFLL